MKDFHPTFVPPEPSEVDKERYSKVQAHINAVSDAVNTAKENWLERMLKKHLPPEIFGLSDKKPRKRLKLARYLAGNGYQLQEHSDRTCLVHGQTILSEFKWRLNKGKVEISQKDLTPPHQPS